MIYLHKILPVFLSPIFIVICLLLLTMITRRRRYAALGAAVLWILSMPIVDDKLTGYLEAGLVRFDAPSIDRADAIVVLSGMITTVRGEKGLAEEWSDPDRFFGGLELFQANRAPTLIFTRGQLPWTNQSMPEGDYLKQVAVRFGISADKIRLTDNVVNTAQEAVATKKLFEEEGLVQSEGKGKIILVTSAFHMPRAVALFKAQGFEVLTFPVDFKRGVGAVTFMSYLPNAYSLQQSSLFFREMLGRFYYGLK